MLNKSFIKIYETCVAIIKIVEFENSLATLSYRDVTSVNDVATFLQ